MSWAAVAIAAIQEGGKLLMAWLTKTRETTEPKSDPVDVRHATESHITASREGKLAAKLAKENNDGSK